MKIVPGKGITRGGEPYFVKGAGGEKHLDELVAAGGNSIRTWTRNGLDEILDRGFDGLVLPGGHAPGMRQYLEAEALFAKVAEAFEKGMPVGAI